MPEHVITLDSVKVVVRFQPVRLGGLYGGEDAWLGWANDHLVALMVRISGRGLPRARHGWFLEAGFGPCRGEGVFFPTLPAADDGSMGYEVVLPQLSSSCHGCQSSRSIT
jgi:hypothetical protein